MTALVIPNAIGIVTAKERVSDNCDPWRQDRVSAVQR